MNVLRTVALHFACKRALAPLVQVALVALVSVSLMPRPVHAEVPEGVQAKLAALQPAFQAMVERHQTARTYPSLENPDDAKVLKQLWDRPAVLGTKPYTGVSIAPAIEILKIQNVVLRSFRQHAEEGDAGQRGGAQNEDIMVAAQEMMVHTTAVVAQSVKSYVEASPVGALTDQQRAELARMRIGFTSLHAQIIESFRLYNFKRHNVDRLVGALAETAPDIFPSIPQRQRAQLENALVQGRRAVDGGAVERLDALLVALQAAPCNQVCALK